jgi:predicted Ser/Thr protein kinase
MQSAEPHETRERAGSFVPPKPAALAQHFPQLEILDLVGHGGMGAVYKARQRGLDRLVALKILPPEVAQKLNHPHIVAVHDSGCVGGLHYVLMEYVDGVNLREAIQTKELTPEEALAIVPQICEALQYAHDEGVVHRDIKPENILLDKKGTVKIADFGLARLLNQTPDNFTLTGTHQVMGTPRYMAPEQMEGSHEVDHRADIFSLGVVFYEMLTGELPLGRFDAPSKKVQLDVRLDEIVLRTLEKEPDRRYQNASEIKADVETVHGVRQLPPHINHLQSFEYRSKTELFGWPLLHVVSGPDPQTGRKRVAKGIVAIGDIAVGGLACGGVAVGILTFGGASIGLFAFGGVALGLLLAMGGAAIGTGFSVGGLAVGMIAMGGIVVGGFGYGGVAFAGRAISGQGSDQDAIQLFEPWAAALMNVFPFVMLVFGLIFALVLVGVTSYARRHAGPVDKPIPPDRHHTRHGLVGCLAAFLALVVLCGACLIPVWFYKLAAREASVRREATRSLLQARDAQITAEKRYEAQQHVDLGHWTLTTEGPLLTTTAERVFNLRSEQIPKVNQVLQQIYAAYLEVEAKNSTHETNELGHFVTTVEKFTEKQMADLEENLWSQLDEILDVEQQKKMRALLGVHAGDGTQHLANSKWRPGILGWGRYGCRIELWKVGAWYHWKTDIPRSTSRRYMPQGSAPELPTELKRFWRE